jgi:hypothetical protein
MNDAKESNRVYLGVGAAFIALAAALGVAMDNWVFALPFAVLALTFVVLGLKPTRPADDGADHHS